MKLNRFILAVLSAFCIAAGFGQLSVFAQANGCLSLTANMGRGADDVSSNGAVTQLQAFLAKQGYLSTANLVTGHFGPRTSAAVAKFQIAQNIPGTGYLGPLTRSSIARLSCAASTTPAPMPSAATAPAQATTTQNQTLSIIGLESPKTLVPHQVGTWTVRVASGNYAGPINYSVDWNDGQPPSSASVLVDGSSPTHASPPFVHQYGYLGTYDPVFTITDKEHTQATSTTYEINLSSY